ncbi:hypothetical protein [Hymenobacter weizhouensis]|uniref:hypothetical protein n=1 Tax=Hymenobacter sp. YIM 151500-1 TaxID=2987689 RepID=UPI00222728E5|nr:hypothetical protein [Hymenobacter sp. YIM 151500-1]UYZ64712.1 hypothetical protein OIS53_07645 [Hymenobacter sp. YIM 151500-1]
MLKFLLALLLLTPAATAWAQTAAPASGRTLLVASLGRASYTNHGWPGTAVSFGVERRLSGQSWFSVQPRLGGFWTDAASREPDKRPGEKCAVGFIEAVVAVRTSRRPERVAFRAEAGPAFLVGREISVYRYPGSYLNPDGLTTTVVTETQFERRRIRHPGFTLGVGVDATVQQRLYLGAGIESRTYSYFPGDLLSATVRVGYVLP